MQYFAFTDFLIHLPMFQPTPTELRPGLAQDFRANPGSKPENNLNLDEVVPFQSSKRTFGLR